MRRLLRRGDRHHAIQSSLDEWTAPTYLRDDIGNLNREEIYASFPAVEDAVEGGYAFDDYGDDLDCEDVASRAEVQAYLEGNPADADYLDGDGDGITCEWGT